MVAPKAFRKTDLFGSFIHRHQHDIHHAPRPLASSVYERNERKENTVMELKIPFYLPRVFNGVPRFPLRHRRPG